LNSDYLEYFLHFFDETWSFCASDISQIKNSTKNHSSQRDGSDERGYLAVDPQSSYVNFMLAVEL